MAATVLHELGYATVNLGPQTPARSLAEAAAMHAARLAWLSLSTEKAVERLESALPDLLAAMESSRTRLIVGGRASNLLRPRGGSQIVFGNSMAELAAYARGMMTAAEAGRKATTAGN
jgi:methanogenic corrinoid protein MtbC1